MLASNSTLKRLDIRSNELTDEGVNAILTACEANSTVVLEEIDLSNNDISEETRARCDSIKAPLICYQRFEEMSSPPVEVRKSQILIPPSLKRNHDELKVLLSLAEKIDPS